MKYLQSHLRESPLAMKEKRSRRFKWSSCFSHDLLLLVLLVAFPLFAKAQNTDLFNYDTTRSWENGQDYGPRDWGDVECDDIEECVSICFGCNLPSIVFMLTLFSLLHAVRMA